MPKEKINIGIRMQHLFRKHYFLKIISLLLAMMIWLYVRGEISSFN